MNCLCIIISGAWGYVNIVYYEYKFLPQKLKFPKIQKRQRLYILTFFADNICAGKYVCKRRIMINESNRHSKENRRLSYNRSKVRKP